MTIDSTGFLNLLLNCFMLIGLGSNANRLAKLLKIVRNIKPRPDEQPKRQLEYTYWGVEPDVYRIEPCPPAYMYLDGIAGVEWIRLEGKELVVKTSIPIETIIAILNSAIAINCYYENWFSDV